MKEDTKSIGINYLVTIGLILSSLIIPTFFDEPQYYCEFESSIKACDGGLSSGSGTRCYLDEEKTNWDYCKSSWYLVTDDLKIQEDPKVEILKEIPSIKIIDTWGKSFKCDINSCEEIK